MFLVCYLRLFKLILAVSCGYKSLVVFVLTTINKVQQLIKGLSRKLSQLTICGRSHHKKNNAYLAIVERF